MQLRATMQKSPPDNHRRIPLFVFWGQSHIGGAQDATELPNSEYPFYYHKEGAVIPGGKFWDKISHPTRKTLDLVDPARDNTPCQWRDMVIGVADGFDYPWDEGTTLPPRSWPAMFTHLWRSVTGEECYVLMCAFGGTTLELRNGIGWKSSVYGSGPGVSYLQIMLDAYWAPALSAAIEDAGGDRSRVELCGVFNMIGTSEGFSQPALDAHYDNLINTTDFICSRIAPGNPGSVPYFILKSPKVPGTASYHDQVRANQEAVAAARPHVQTIETSWIPLGGDNIHFGYLGNDMLASEMVRAALGATPLIAPLGD